MCLYKFFNQQISNKTFKYSYGMDNFDSTVVKLAPRDPKVKGSSLVPAVVTGREKASKSMLDFKRIC